jgi:hypothetical protein
MLNVKVEQRVNVKFLAKLGKSTRDTYNLLMEVFMATSANPCIGRVPLHQEKKSMEEQVQFESNDDLFFSISEG